MSTAEELRTTIEDAQSRLIAIEQAGQLEVGKQNRIDQIEAARAVVERTDNEITNLEEKIEELRQRLDDAIKERFLSRQNYSSPGVSTKVDNTSQQFIGLKTALLEKTEQRKKLAERHAELLRLEESYAPKV